MKEAEVEKAVCEYALTRGYWVRKFVSPGYSGVPDRIFIKNGVVIFIEFKARGKKATANQLREGQRIRDQGIPCYVCDEIEHGKSIVDRYDPVDEEEL